MEQKITTLLPKCFKIIPIHPVCCCSLKLPTLKKKSFGEGPLINLLWPCPGSTPGRIWSKSQLQMCGSHEYESFIPTKFGKYPSSHSVVKSDSVFLRLIRGVLRASKFSVLKLTEIVILWVYYTIPFGFSLIWHFGTSLFNF